MNTLIVFAHHEPQSFNGAFFRVARETLEAAGHHVRVSDLHAMRFDPVSDRRNFSSVKDGAYLKQQQEELLATEVGGFAPDVDTEMQKVEWCDLMIWHFPLWWFSVPAVLKGWVDRVFAMGRFYGAGRVYATGPCRGKRAMLALTTGGPEKAYVKGGSNGDMAAILRPIQRGMLQFVGFDVLAPHIVYGPTRLTVEERRAQLEAYMMRLRGISREAPIDVGPY